VDAKDPWERERAEHHTRGECSKPQWSSQPGFNVPHKKRAHSRRDTTIEGETGPTRKTIGQAYQTRARGRFYVPSEWDGSGPRRDALKNFVP